MFSTAENRKLVSSHQMWDRKGSNVSCLSRFLAVLDPQTAVEESIYSSVNHRSRLSDSAGFRSLSDTWEEMKAKAAAGVVFNSGDKLALLQGFTTFPRVPFGQLAEQELWAAVRMGHRGGSTALKLHLSCCCLHFLKEWKCFRSLFKKLLNNFLCVFVCFSLVYFLNILMEGVQSDRFFFLNSFLTS